MPIQNKSGYAHQGYVTGVDELTEFADFSMDENGLRTLYVFYPGLTVNASDEDERIDAESP